MQKLIFPETKNSKGHFTERYVVNFSIIWIIEDLEVITKGHATFHNCDIISRCQIFDIM